MQSLVNRGEKSNESPLSNTSLLVIVIHLMNVKTEDYKLVARRHTSPPAPALLFYFSDWLWQVARSPKDVNVSTHAKIEKLNNLINRIEKNSSPPPVSHNQVLTCYF